MAQNLTKSSPYEDDMDFKEFIEFLKHYKKLIISTILIFTITGFIYSFFQKPSFNTSVKLEIGFVEMENGYKDLIESPENLISELRILVLKNPDVFTVQLGLGGDGLLTDGQGKIVSMSLFEGRIIKLEATSSSAENNENLLAEIINYVDEHHSNLFLLNINKRKNLLAREIESTKARLTYSKQTQSHYLSRLSNLDIETHPVGSFHLLQQNSKINDEVFALSQKIELLINDLETLESESLIKTQVIQNFKTKSIMPNNAFTIFLSIIFGLLTGILLAFIHKFIKSYREIEA